MPKEVTEAVIAMMKRVGYIQKTGVNEFHKYKYASIEGVLEKVQPALVECGLAISQNEVSHDIVADGQLMEATYEFVLSHASGAQSSPIRHTGLASLRNTKGGFDDKALNKCHTAARKYYILGMFQIPTGIDADAEEDKPAIEVEDPATQAAKAFVRKAIKDMGECKSTADLQAWFETWKRHVIKLRETHSEEAKILDAAFSAQRDALGRQAAE
jgi:hypothetical protein